MSETLAIALLSGGLDSATAAAIAQETGDDVIGLSFDYGQRHRRELKAAEQVAASLKLREHHCISVDLAAWGGSALIDAVRAAALRGLFVLLGDAELPAGDVRPLAAVVGRAPDRGFLRPLRARRRPTPGAPRALPCSNGSLRFACHAVSRRGLLRLACLLLRTRHRRQRATNHLARRTSSAGAVPPKPQRL